jgi:hypothetical protein
MTLNPAAVTDSLCARHDRGVLVTQTIPSLIVMRETLKGARPTKKRAEQIVTVQTVLDRALKVAGMKREPPVDMNDVELRRVRLYCMAGGGFLGKFAADQPGVFYIDDRASAGSGYSDDTVMKEVKKFAKDIGADRNTVLGPMYDMHSCGIY